MPRVVTIPADTDLLCEGCGYVLTGLPAEAGSRCPECGKPTAESAPDLRSPPVWEQPGPSLLRPFLDTTAAVWLRPTSFFRTMTTRGPARRSSQFAQIHWLLATALFALAAWVHFGWLGFFAFEPGSVTARLVVPLVAVVTYGFLIGMTRLAAMLTTWEASYRGIRLPLPVVLRAMHYHAAHYAPVALLATATVLGYHWLLRSGHVTPLSAEMYLYVLSGEVVLAAVYLFKTYWIGMRNLMYGNT